MYPNTTRITMTNTTRLGRAGGLLLGLLLIGCGPEFDPASLIVTTRVVGARVEIEGAPERATPRPGETANVRWLITSPEVPPSLHWAFAVCASGPLSLGCESAPLASFEGTDVVPRIAVVVPALDALGGARSLMVYGQICSGADATLTFDPQHGIPGCSNGGGTTVSTNVPLQWGDEANHNPTADRGFTIDGQPWLALAPGAAPCETGPRIPAGTEDHVIGNTTAGADREAYTALLGDPPVATAARESLQISQFTTAGKLKSQFSFVEAAEIVAATTVDVTWDAPKVADVSAAEQAVTFTFVTRDNRGGVDWTTRAVCVTR
jgi:hypothetical protein